MNVWVMLKQYAIGAALSLSLTAFAADVKVIDGPYEGEKHVKIQGPIAAGDLVKVQAAAKRAILASENPLTLSLDSPGGDVVESIRIGRFARELQATTTVDGVMVFDPDTPDGQSIFSLAKKYSQVAFGTRQAKRGTKVPDSTYARCYSSCVLVFFAGASRNATDNQDMRSQPPRIIPVMGLHRPYYDKERFASLTPAEARDAYALLEKEVRGYLAEMNAPDAMVERMFRKASNAIDLVPIEEFQEYYKARESYSDEWLIAKCKAFGPGAALTAEEHQQVEHIRQSRKAAMLSGKLTSISAADNFVPLGMTRAQVKALDDKVMKHNNESMSCRTAAVRQFQLQKLTNGPT